MPIRCTQLGLVWCLLLIFVSAMAAYWTGLIKVSRKVNGLDYSPSVRGIIGNYPAIFTDIVIEVYLFGVFVQYQVYYLYFIRKDNL